jgi:SpoVK/Ycf46/Vps4 family AAA+-type ATPase
VGTTIEVPFTTSLLLATNLSPQSLMDEAFLRRIRFKVHVPEPTEQQYRQIWERVCEQNDVEYRAEVVDWLLDTAYRDAGRPLRGVHPRDLMAYLVSAAAYKGRALELTRESMAAAVRAYFVQSEAR